jgi:hypothetical protein
MSGDSLLIRPWCSGQFKARRSGSPKRFCSAGCRSAFWSALRLWGKDALATGVLTIDAVRNGPQEACTLVGDAKAPQRYPG